MYRLNKEEQVLLQIHLVASLMFPDQWIRRLTSSSSRPRGHMILTTRLPKPPGTPLKGTYQMLTWFLPFLGPLVAILLLSLCGSCVFNFLVDFVSSGLQQFQVKLMVVEGFQPAPVEGGPSPYKPLEQSARHLQGRIGARAPTQQEAVSEEETFGPFCI